MLQIHLHLPVSLGVLRMKGGIRERRSLIGRKIRLVPGPFLIRGPGGLGSRLVLRILIVQRRSAAHGN